jgi:tight adherence protein B
MVFLVLLGVFAGTVALCIGTWAYLYHRRLGSSMRAQADRTGDRLGGNDERPAPVLRDTTASDLEILDRLLSRTSLAARLARELRRAGSSAKPDAFLLALGIGATGGALVGTILGAWLALPLALVGFAFPFGWLERRQRQRQIALRHQLPEALDMLVSAMRAGYSFQTAMKLVGDETPAPLGFELLQFYEEHRFGIEPRAALLALQDRCRTAETKMFVTAVLVHRDAGGSLSDVLRDVLDVLRRRSEASQRIDTLRAESRVAARVLTVVPFLAFGALVALDVGAGRPSSAPIDPLVLLYVGVSTALGYRMLMRIAKVDR